MKTSIVLLTIIAGSILATPAWAGSASNPEVIDAAGDAPGSVDIVSAWVHATATDLSVTIKLSDLSQSSPLLDNEGSIHNYYRTEFVLSTTGARYFLEGQIHGVDTQTEAGTSTPRVTGPVVVNVGTQFAGGRMGSQPTSLGGTVSVDAAAGTITVTTPRGTLFAPGATLSQISVTTFFNTSPHEVESAASNLIGGGRTVKDTAPASRAFLL